ncbi:hypothetical protein QZH41_019409 [Actinostola sp. cb2023]|nr:hypothetical protein QZH41_019409 [Actinostola sp. cb2023]
MEEEYEDNEPTKIEVNFSHMYWQQYQRRLLDSVKEIKDGVVIAGDGRHDSMGHCAKYGAYTVFFVLFQRSFTFLLFR